MSTAICLHLHLMLYILQVQHLTSHMTQRDHQHAHQLRKKEHEIVHIQEQLRCSLGLGRAAAQHNRKHHRSNRHLDCEICRGGTGSAEGDSTT